MHEEKEYREGLLTQLVSMISFGPIENLNDENSSEEETIEQECSTDIMYLSANLRAAIEGSTMDRLSSRDILSLKFSCITKDLRKYMGKLKTLDFENEYQKFANLPVAEPILQEEAKVLEVKEQEIKHHSAFSFSSPEKKSIHISPIKANQEPSLSSEWEISSEIIEQDENSKDESGKWNSISVISLHSVSNSSSSEACESVELLHKPPVMQGTQTEFKKKSCWRRFFCCFKS